jgi:hypothetical protein
MLTEEARRTDMQSLSTDYRVKLGNNEGEV